MPRVLSITVLLLLSLGVQANGLFKHQRQGDFESIYKQTYTALETARFFVVQELDMGRSLAGFAARWGDDYNRNKLDNIRSMLVCNAWYANQVGNKDPDMLGLCPLRINLVSKGRTTTILFARPTSFATGSSALPILEEVEETVIRAIKGAE